MSIYTIEQRVASWNTPKAVEIHEQAIVDFKASPKRTPADYFAKGLKKVHHGAVVSAWFFVTSGYVVPKNLWATVGDKHLTITNHKSLSKMTAHMDGLKSGWEAEVKSADAKSNDDGTKFAKNMATITSATKLVGESRAVPTKANIEAAEALLLFAQSNLNRLTLALGVEEKAGKTTRSKVSK